MTRRLPASSGLNSLFFAVNVIALIAYLVSPGAAEFPQAGLGILAFLMVQAFLPACRLNASAPLCPANVAQGFFWIQTVFTSLLIGYWGFYLGTLPRLPSAAALATAVYVQVLGYLSYCVAFQLLSNSPRGHDNLFDSMSRHKIMRMQADDERMSRLVIPFAVLGLIGFLLVFQDIRGFFAYFGNPDSHRLELEKEPTLGGAAGTFLRYFLGFSIVLAWSLWIERQNHSQNRARAVAGTLAIAVLLLIASLSFNRGSVLGPLVALAAAASRHVVRLSFTGVIVAGGLAIAAAQGFGAYRASNVSSNPSFAWTDLALSQSTVEMTQVYASGPQLGAYLIEQLDRDGKFYYGSTLVPSLLYPVPVLGKPLRPYSGVYIFNELIYGDPDVLDQLIPLGTELYMNFHFFGVMAGYGLLGCLLCWYQRRFMSARTAIECYCWMTLALWTIFPGSLPVASQLYVYAFWPIYIYWASQALGRGMPARRRARHSVPSALSGKAGIV